MLWYEILCLTTLALWIFLFILNSALPSMHGRVVIRSQNFDFFVFCVSLSTMIGFIVTRIAGI